MPGRRGEEKTPVLGRLFFLLLAGFILLCDQLAKFLAQSFLSLGTTFPVWPSVFHLTLVENQGIAFGLFQGFEKILFVVISLSLTGLVLFGLKSRPQPLSLQCGMGLILGGAFGNWIDRIRVGAVIDFLDFRIWPVFNLADTAITIGVGLFLMEMLRKRHVS